VSKKRYAICLHGLVGTLIGKSGGTPKKRALNSADNRMAQEAEVLRVAFKHWDKYVFSENNIDIFIHSWDEYWEKDIVRLFKPKKHIFERQRIFSLPSHIIRGENPPLFARYQNHYSRWYSLMRSVELKSKYEKEQGIKYDGVMVARFDIAWMNSVIFNEYDMKNFYVSGWYRGDKNRGMSRLKDIWFFSSSKNINKFATLYEKIDNYCILPKFDKEKKGISSHSLARHHCDINNLNIKETMKLYESKGKIDVDRSDYALVRELYSPSGIPNGSASAIIKYKAVARNRKKYI